MTYFLIYFFQFEDHQIGKFSNNIDFRKLSEEKISECSHFVLIPVPVECVLIYSSLKNSCLQVFIESILGGVFVYKAGAFTNFLFTKKPSFLKSLLLLNFPIQ